MTVLVHAMTASVDSDAPPADSASELADARSALRRYDAERREASTASIAEGGVPVRRMSAPGALRRASIAPDGSGVIPFWISKSHGLTCAMPGEEPHKATAESVATAFSAPHLVAMPIDKAALRAMVALCRKAGEAHQTTARLIDFTARLPICSQLLVLTEALGRAYWMPSGRSAADIPAWRSAFGFDATVGSLARLAGRVFDDEGLTGRQDGYVRSLFIAEEKAISARAARGASAAASAFTASNGVSEAWSALERTDAILRYRFLHTGEVSRAKPVKMVGGGVLATVSTPFKLRPGGVLVMDEGDREQAVGDATLTHLGFEDNLIGVFHGVSGSSQRRNKTGSRGISAMIAAISARDSVLVTAAPYLGTSRVTSVHRWATWNGLSNVGSVERDLPFDIALAGAPFDDGA